MNSKEYDAFVEKINDHRKLDSNNYVELSKRMEKIDKIWAYVVVVPLFVGVISIVAFVVSLFFSFSAFSTISAIIGGVMITTAIVAFAIYIKFVEKKKDEIKKQRYIYDGDTIALVGNQGYGLLTAGYNYYLGMKNNIDLAEKRLAELMDIPELLQYINENDFAFKGSNRDLNKDISAYRKHLTTYFGNRIQRSPEFKLFYRPNSEMFESIISRYDGTEKSLTFVVDEDEALFEEPYELAWKYYDRWCKGDAESRTKFKNIYRHPDVIKGYLQNKTKKVVLPKGSYICFSDRQLDFTDIISKVAGQ